MTTNFYIQPVDGSQVDIEATYGIRVTSVRGLDPASPKDVFKRDWALENGVDVYIPTTRKSKETEVTISCLAEDSVGKTAKEKYESFITDIYDGQFDYWDTLQKSKVRCIFTGNKSTWYQFVGNKQIMFEVTLLNPTGQKTNIA